MTEKEWKKVKPGSLVNVEGVGVMQVYKMNGVKYLRAHGVIGYDVYEVTNLSKVHLLQPAPTGT